MIVTSPKYQLTIVDFKKLGTGLGIALLGAALTYLTEQIPNIDFGQWTPIVVAFWSVVVNTVRKWLTTGEYIEN